MENVVVIGVLAGLSLASEWWLRRHGTKGELPDGDVSIDPPGDRLPTIRRLPTGEVPFDALQGRLAAARRPPTISAN